MRTTRYLVEQVLRKRPDIDPAWCLDVLDAPLCQTIQDEGRIGFWNEVTRTGEQAPRFCASSHSTLGRSFTARSSIAAFGEISHEASLYPHTDSLHVELNPTASAEPREILDGVNVDLDRDGSVVGFDIDQASKCLDLSTLETSALPFRTTRAA